MRKKRNLNLIDWALIVTSVLTFGIYVVYTYTFIFATPYLGFDYTRESDPAGLKIIASSQENLSLDQIIVAINGMAITDLPPADPIYGLTTLSPGDHFFVTLSGEADPVQLTMPDVRFTDKFERGLSLATFLVFWIAGTAAYIFLQPRDTGWVLLVLFMHLIALFLVVGGVSSLGILSSRQILRVVSIILGPVMVHLHWRVPSFLAPRQGKRVIGALYILTAVLLLLEFTGIIPLLVPPLLLLSSVLATVAILAYRYYSRHTSPSDRIAVRLMIAGIMLALGPGIISTVPVLLGQSPGSLTTVQISLFATPILPLFYIYAIYKRHLGKLEFRTNRLLSTYSFLVFYTLILVTVIWAGHQLIESIAAKNAFLILTTIIFVLASPSLNIQSQRLINRLAYGSQHNPDEIIRLFANRIPSILKRDALYELLTSQITPALLIRQSALYLFDGNQIHLVYAEGIDASIDQQIIKHRQNLLAHSNRYVPPQSNDGAFAWVRLTIPLILRNDIIGIWLFGRRDPDDFYPQNDIDLLYTLANQIAPVIENITLYEELQHQRDTLADQVQERTIELRTERDRTQAILDNAGEGIFFADTAGTILYANMALASISGHETSTLLGQPLSSWHATVESAEMLQPLLEAIAAGNGWNGQLLLQQPSGHQVDVSLSTSPIRDEHGQTSGFVGVVSDISQAKEIDRLKTNIISNVSHELKTPLTNIRLYLELLNKGREKRLPEYIDILSKEAEKLNRLIMDLLTASQLEMGTMPIELIPTDISLLVDESMRHCAPAAAKKSIILENVLPADLPNALADASQLERVLTNLIVNAVNYTPEGSVVTVSGGQDDKSTVWLSVADNGTGIPEKDIPHLFERFYRGETGRDSKASGTGLGLSICKEIMDMHHGSITVTSPPGRGATFTLRLLSDPTETNVEIH
ncbi:MAG: PAS domain S-box protein [Anaerolineales bacterium]|nr:PAS domain S-box protein [Anaerolineales bacterium]